VRIAFTPRHWSIRAKGVLVAIGYLLALSGIYSTFTIYLYRREAEQAYDRFEQTARIVAGDLDAYVDNGEQRLRTVTRLPGLAYGLQTIQEARPNAYIPPWTTLHYLFFKSPVFTGGVFLLDRAGKVLWTEPPGLPWHGETLTDIEPVAAMYETRRGIVSAVLAEDRLLARPHVIIGVPVENETGEMQGVLAGIVDLTAIEFRGVLAAVSTTAGRFVEVLDQRGVVLAGTDPSRLFRRSDRYGSDGEKPMLASLSLSRAPWRIVAGQPRSLGLAAVRRLQRALWGIGGALLIVAATIATPILNGFVRSIKQLTQAAETVARGDLTQPVTVGERSDEIGTLARSFELMRVQLSRSRQALEQRLEEREELVQLLMRTNEELKAAQKRLIEAERFAAIGELSAAVAHGIRNPVAGIKAAAQFAALDLPKEHPLCENIADIITETDKLEARIKTLLDFAKPFEPHPRRCRVDAIVGDAVDSLRSQLAARRIEVVIDVDRALPAVAVDYAQIEQVLLALISNAVEAMTEGGRISIRVRSKGGDRLRLEVEDSGPGIRPDQLRRIFDLFFTTKSSGTGMGLAVARKIVERHGGTITVESEVGKGTQFTIELPISRATT